MKNQAYNPYLPLNEYIPDGEPHVFGDRVYIFGSHDEEGGYTFCMRDYVTYSAPIDDLTDWRYEGVIYKANQDPNFGKIFFNGECQECGNSKDEISKSFRYMYAPDVVQGNDGKFYLYYCMAGDYGKGGYTGPISVAVCDTPAGEYRFLGHVKNPDGTLMTRFICFDPAVINDDGTIRLYYGTHYSFEEEPDFETNPTYLDKEVDMFGRSKENILSYKETDESIMGAVALVLDNDMLTVKEPPKHIIPYKTKGTAFEKHGFFEGSSIRKVGKKYYFIYSSHLNHELCYATSDYPDKDFVFGGTIVSNGDVGINNRSNEDRLNMSGTTHGGIEQINGEWYVFYHRLTHKSDYSRQSCAEKIHINEDGTINQVEITSCGLNNGPLKGEGVYPAPIACNITQGRMPHGSNSIYRFEFPHVTHCGEARFIAEIENETILGYKYFDINDLKSIKIHTRFETDANKVICDVPLRNDERCANEEARIKEYLSSRKPFDGKIPYFEVRTSLDGDEKGRILLDHKASDSSWDSYEGDVKIPNGINALFFIYHGNEKIQLLDFELCV